MKHLKIIAAAALIAFVLTPVLHHSSAAALSDSKAQACYDKWNGKNVDRNASGTYSLPNAYVTSDCPSGKGGNCDVKAINDSTGKIKCDQPSSSSSTTSGGAYDPALDYDANGCGDGGSCNFITKYVNPTVRFLSALVGVVVVISIIIGAIQYSTSSGDPQKVSAAKDRIFKALLALVVYIFLFALLQWALPGGII